MSLQQQYCDDSNKPNTAVALYHKNQFLSQFYKPFKTFSFTDAGFNISISQEYDQLGVAGVVWEGSIILSKYLAKNPEKVQSKKVLELGAGTGLAGMVASKLGGKVVITDLSKALPLIQKNVAKNFDSNFPEILELEWNVGLETFVHQDFDVILGADVIYSERLFRALRNTLKHFTPKVSTTVFLASKLRYDRIEKFIEMIKNLFEIKLLDHDKTSNVVIYQLNSLS